MSGIAQQSAPAALRKIRDAYPVYPLVALKAGVQGPVDLELTIGADGRVSNVLFLRGHVLLRDSAIRAASRWAYDVRGATTPVKMAVTVPFTRLRSTDVTGLLASVNRDVWVVGKIARVDTESDGGSWLLYLEAPRDVFVPASPVELKELRTALQSAFDWGPDKLIGRTIAFSAQPTDFRTSIRLNLTFTVGAIKLLDQ